MNFDIKDEFDGKIQFKTDKPLVFIRKETDNLTVRPWVVYVLAIDEYLDYGEKWYYPNQFRSYRRARLNMDEELVNYDGHSEFRQWPAR